MQGAGAGTCIAHRGGGEPPQQQATTTSGASVYIHALQCLSLSTETMRSITTVARRRLSSLRRRQLVEERVLERLGHADAVRGVVLEHTLYQVEEGAVVGLVNRQVALQTHTSNTWSDQHSVQCGH